MNFVRGTVKDGCLFFGRNKLDIAPLLGDKLSDYEGKPLVFGFRPEAIQLGEQKDAYLVNATVELTEMLGDNTNVYIHADDDQAILKVDPHDTPEMDSQLLFSIPYETVSLFDGETEMAIKR